MKQMMNMKIIELNCSYDEFDDGCSTLKCFFSRLLNDSVDEMIGDK